MKTKSRSVFIIGALLVSACGGGGSHSGAPKTADKIDPSLIKSFEYVRNTDGIVETYKWSSDDKALLKYHGAYTSCGLDEVLRFSGSYDHAINRNADGGFERRIKIGA